jgi:hypothetical protein
MHKRLITRLIPIIRSADIVLIRVAIGGQGDGREIPGMCHTPARRC